MDTASTPLAASLFDPANAANPFSLFAHLRTDSPVTAIPMPFGLQSGAAWLVTRYADAVAVLKDPRFTVDAQKIDPESAPGGAARADSLA